MQGKMLDSQSQQFHLAELITKVANEENIFFNRPFEAPNDQNYSSIPHYISYALAIFSTTGLITNYSNDNNVSKYFYLSLGMLVACTINKAGQLLGQDDDIRNSELHSAISQLQCYYYNLPDKSNLGNSNNSWKTTQELKLDSELPRDFISHLCGKLNAAISNGLNKLLNNIPEEEYACSNWWLAFHICDHALQIAIPKGGELLFKDVVHVKGPTLEKNIEFLILHALKNAIRYSEVLMSKEQITALDQAIKDCSSQFEQFDKLVNTLYTKFPGLRLKHMPTEIHSGTIGDALVELFKEEPKIYECFKQERLNPLCEKSFIEFSSSTTLGKEELKDHLSNAFNKLINEKPNGQHANSLTFRGGKKEEAELRT